MKWKDFKTCQAATATKLCSYTQSIAQLDAIHTHAMATVASQAYQKAVFSVKCITCFCYEIYLWKTITTTRTNYNIAITENQIT